MFDLYALISERGKCFQVTNCNTPSKYTLTSLSSKN